MIYSYTQLNTYLNCPRAYRHRYVDGWQEKESRPALLFGRAFENSLAALFRREDAAATLYEEWGAFKHSRLAYSSGDTWDRMFHQGVALLNRFAQDDRIHISRPTVDLQIKFERPLSGLDRFVAHIDGIGSFEGERCLIEWKTTSRRYPEDTPNLFSLDPQLVCYSWVTGIPDVAVVVFVRKQMAEIQYIPATISQEQRDEFGMLVEETIARINSSSFTGRSGVRFPQNQCISCPYLGLCLHDEKLVAERLLSDQRDELAWTNELEC
jgi:hypothetical protein